MIGRRPQDRLCRACNRQHRVPPIWYHPTGSVAFAPRIVQGYLVSRDLSGPWPACRSWIFCPHCRLRRAAPLAVVLPPSRISRSSMLIALFGVACPTAAVKGPTKRSAHTIMNKGLLARQALGLSLGLTIIVFCTFASAGDRPRFHGPDGSGVSLDKRSLPVTWSETAKLRWNASCSFVPASSSTVWPNRTRQTANHS